MKNIIHIIGASGSGTTTIGRAINQKYGHTQLDSDNYYWHPTDIPYTQKRLVSQRQIMMKRDIENNKKCVISGSFVGWGDIFIPLIELIIFVDTPMDIRIERLKEREYKKYGVRILPGGDMNDVHREFLEWSKRYDTAGTEQRSKKQYEDWLKKVSCEVIPVDGSRTIDDIMSFISPYIENDK